MKPSIMPKSIPPLGSAVVLWFAAITFLMILVDFLPRPPKSTSSDLLLYILFGPVLGLASEIGPIFVFLLSLPVLFLLRMAILSSRWRVLEILVAIAYWLVLGAFFSVGMF